VPAVLNLCLSLTKSSVLSEFLTTHLGDKGGESSPPIKPGQYWSVMKIVISMLLLVGSFSSFAAEKTVCTNRGDMKGSFYLDITGYEALLHDDSKSMTTTLNYKPFRSWPNHVDNMVCFKANAYLHGPAGMLACRSSTQLTHYEVTVLKSVEDGLVARVKDSDGFYSQVPCAISETN